MNRADSLRRGALAVLLGVVAATATAVLSDSLTFLAISVAVYSLLALSLLPILGGVGLLSLAQLSFAAIGAAVVGKLDGRIPFLVAAVAAGLVAALAGLAIGAMSARLRGVQFAVATLSLAAAGDVVLSHASVPGFRYSDSVHRPALFAGTHSYLVLCIVILAVLGWALVETRRSLIGHRWDALRFSERGAAAAGVNVPRSKLGAAAISAGIAGVAGAFMVGQYGFLTANSVAPINGLVLIAVVMVGGVGTVSGCVAAGLLAVAVPELLRRLGLPTDAAPILFGLGAIATLHQGDGGIAGQLAALMRRFVRRFVRRFGAPRRAAVSATADRSPAALDDVASRGVQRAEPVQRAVLGVPVLSLRGLTVTYGSVRALDGVNLEVPRGTITGLIGANGAGKSTLIDAVTGFVPNYSGTVNLASGRLDGPAWTRARCGVRRTFQQGRAVPGLPVADYLSLCAGHRLPDAEVWRLIDLLALPAPERLIGEIDVVTRRAVEIAGALAARPAVVLLDEPAAGLGGDGSQRLAQQIRALPELFETSVVLVEHDVELIRAACDLVYVLDAGSVLACGPPDVVLARGDVAEAYLGVSS